MGWDSIVLWPALCGQEIFWNYSQSVDTDVPDLTPCFQQTVLLWLPCGILWLCLPFYTPYLISQTDSSRTRARSKVNVAKIVICALLAVLAVIDLTHVVTAQSVTNPQTVATYLNPIVRIATFVIAAIYIDWEFRARIHSSGVFFVFWFFLVLCGIVPFRSKILQVQTDSGSIEDPLGFTTFYIYYGLSVIMLTITSFVVERWSTSEVDDDERRPLLSGTSDSKPRHTKTLPCPEAESSFLSKLTNWWIMSLLLKGFRNPLTFDDLYDVLPEDRSVVIFDKFSREWSRQVKRSKPSLLRALVMTSIPQLTITVIFRAINSLWPFLNPLALPLAIEWVSGNDPYMWKGYGLAFMLLAINALTPTIQNIHMKNSSVMAFRMRTAIVAAVYRKALKLSSATRRSTTVGEIVNLMSVDAQKIQDAAENIHELWAAPIMFVLALYMLWNTLGPSSLASIGVYAILLPVFFVTGAKYESRQEKQMKLKDDRIKMTSELLSSIKVLKMYAWEPSFARMITDIRWMELRCLRSQSMLSAVFTIAWNCATYVVPLAMFGVYVLSSADNYLDPQTAFVTITLVGNLSWGATFIMFLPFFLEAFVSMNRIKTFLCQDEIDPSIIDHNALTDYTVEIRGGTFSWGAESDGPVLSNIELQVPPGGLVAVVGAVGAGKSSLISALIGELKVLQGSINVKGSVAYVPQQAWIQNKTLRNNILFNQSYDESKYNRIIDACALLADFKMLPAGDMTEIGEKGINLSGGQKQRVSVARSIYQSADVYLLDDPLSAVDAHIGKHLFDKVVGPEGLLRHTTRIFVTHGVTYLPRCDVIVVMRDGEISECGTYQELLDRNAAFADFLRQYLTEIGDEETMQDPILKQLERQLSHLSDGVPDTSSTDKDSGLRRRISRIISVDKEKEKEKDTDKDHHGRGKGSLIEEEEAAVGNVGLAVVWNYFRAVTLPFLVCTALCSAIFVGSSVGQSVWLSEWSDDPYVNSTEGKAQTNFRLGVYAAFGVVQICSSFGATLAVLLGGVKASRTIHMNLLTRIIRAPMSFFDTTPLGRIVNRFSGDIDTIDTVLPNKFDWWLFAVFNVVSSLVVICYSTPLFTAILIPIVIVYIIVQRAYIRSVRQMQRIDSIRRSPIFVNFDETLVGVASVRAYGRQQEFIQRNDRLVDDSNRAWYPILIARRWLGFFLDMLGAAIIFFATVFAVLSRGTITGGLVGLSLSFAFTATFLINVLVTESSELETNIVAAERIRQYSNVESEAALVVENQRPQEGWPEGGQISFVDYSTRYRPGLDLVLRSINLSLRAGEKVGVVGRTGAGKSSMALSMFRIIEPAEGSIVIDGVDISKIGLQDLRSQLTVIPQEAVLFSGSIRRNLDPFSVYSDDVIWETLEHAHLKTFISQLPTSLEHDVGEGGEALSVGQRQLVCLARALLRKSRVLVLDEATAAVDMETDDLIQATIRSNFADCTVLTIAHRLNTIMDYDRVMVLDGGQIKELDSPASLLKDPESVFYGLAKDAGLVA